uniref:MFS domain-containing protein n=1 Tax=Rhabditophanes sp. KR3021 TaxID=114890 RepID=A0AC35U2J7_9BILA
MSKLMLTIVVSNMTAMKRERTPDRWVPIALDGGWGYMVILGSFAIHVIADGIVYAFGVMAKALMETFQVSNAQVSIIVSLLVGITLASGPVASGVTNKYGCRITTIVGAFIASIGLFAASFATNIYYVMVFAGAVTGVGFGFIYCPAIVIVTMYFEKYRALATGIAVCGAGVGTAIFSPLQEWIISNYSWQAALRINAGFTMLCILAGLTFAPLEFMPVWDKKEGELDEEVEETVSETKMVSDLKDDAETKSLLEVGKIVRPAISHQDISLQHDNGLVKRTISTSSGLNKDRSKNVTESSGYLDIKDVFYQGSVTHLPEYQKEGEKFRSVHSLHSRTASHGAADLKKVGFEEDEKQLVSQSTDAGVKEQSGFMKAINKYTDLSLLQDPIFILFAVSNFFTSVGFNAPMAFLVSHGVRLGLTNENASLIMSAWGICNTVGRVVFGLISDMKFPFKGGDNLARNRLWIYNISLIVNGLVTGFSFLFTDFYGIIFFGAFIGLSISSYVCLTSVILVDLIGVDKLTNGFGMLLLFQGIATFVGPPLAGIIADATDSYNWAFFMCGTCIAISGAMLFGVSFLQRKLNRVPEIATGKAKDIMLH